MMIFCILKYAIGVGIVQPCAFLFWHKFITSGWFLIYVDTIQFYIDIWMLMFL